MLNPMAAKKPLLLLAVTVPLMMLGGCATRESVRNAQASADAANSHALDAGGRADRAQARADEAAGIGGNAMTLAQSTDQKTAQLQTDLDKANARISYLQRNVVMKKVKHVKHRKVVRHKVHAAPAVQATPNNS